MSLSAVFLRLFPRSSKVTSESTVCRPCDCSTVTPGSPLSCAKSTCCSGTSTSPTTPVEVETLSYDNAGTVSSKPVSPVPPSKTCGSTEDHPPRLRARLWASFVVYFCIGWGDGATGIILPYFQSDYHVDYTQVSTVFIAGVVGILVGTLIFEKVVHVVGRVYVNAGGPVSAIFTSLSSRKRTNPETSQFYFSKSRGRAWTLYAAILVHAVYYVIMGLKAGFVSVLVAFVISGVARAFMFGVLNSYVNGLASKPLGQLHGFWGSLRLAARLRLTIVKGLGGLASPLVCQAMISSKVGWSNFYLVSLILSAVSLSVAVLSFRPTRREATEELGLLINPIARPTEKTESSNVASGQTGTLFACFTSPMLLAFYVFLFFSSGGETSTNGFIVTYLLHERHADPLVVGYYASVFWVGFAVSRVAMGFISHRNSFRVVKNIVHCLLFGALCLNLCVWLVDSLAANVVFMGLIGLAIGPLFPTVVHLAVQLIPERLHMVGIALMSAAASLGSAIMPFVSGVLSNDPKIGPEVLPKMLLGEYGLLVVLWFFFPSKSFAT